MDSIGLGGTKAMGSKGSVLSFQEDRVYEPFKLSKREADLRTLIVQLVDLKKNENDGKPNTLGTDVVHNPKDSLETKLKNMRTYLDKLDTLNDDKK